MKNYWVSDEEKPAFCIKVFYNGKLMPDWTENSVKEKLDSLMKEINTFEEKNAKSIN